MTKRFLSIPEVIAELGVARTTAYRLVREGVLPSTRIGGAGIRVPRSALEQFVQEMEKEARSTTAA